MTPPRQGKVHRRQDRLHDLLHRCDGHASFTIKLHRPPATAPFIKMGNSASSSKISAQDKCAILLSEAQSKERNSANTQHRAILDMKNQRDKLHQYQRRITVLTSREKEIAKQMLAKGDKPKALLALRRKKYQESLLEKTDAQLEQLEKLTSSVEFALVQKDVVFGLQQGTSVLKEIHKEMGGLEHVEKLMGETADAVAYQQVSCALCHLYLGRWIKWDFADELVGGERYARREDIESR